MSSLKIELNRKLRTAVFLFLYATETSGNNDQETIDMVYEVAKIEAYSPEVFLEFIEQAYREYSEHKVEYEEKLKEFLPNWNQTYEATKYALYAYLIERSLYPKIETPIKDYIRFTQDYIGGDNPKLIHAVLSKLEQST